MGMTIGEKIIARAAKVDQVKAGEIHTLEKNRKRDAGSIWKRNSYLENTGKLSQYE